MVSCTSECNSVISYDLHRYQIQQVNYFSVQNLYYVFEDIFTCIIYSKIVSLMQPLVNMHHVCFTCIMFAFLAYKVKIQHWEHAYFIYFCHLVSIITKITFHMRVAMRYCNLIAQNGWWTCIVKRKPTDGKDPYKEYRKIREITWYILNTLTV